MSSFTKLIVMSGLSIYVGSVILLSNSHSIHNIKTKQNITKEDISHINSKLEGIEQKLQILITKYNGK